MFDPGFIHVTPNLYISEIQEQCVSISIPTSSIFRCLSHGKCVLKNGKALTKIPLAEGEAAAAEAGVQFSKEEVKWGIPPSVLTPTHLSAAHYTFAPESAPPRKRGARKRELA